MYCEGTCMTWEGHTSVHEGTADLVWATEQDPVDDEGVPAVDDTEAATRTSLIREDCILDRP